MTPGEFIRQPTVDSTSGPSVPYRAVRLGEGCFRFAAFRFFSIATLSILRHLAILSTLPRQASMTPAATFSAGLQHRQHGGIQRHGTRPTRVGVIDTLGTWE